MLAAIWLVGLITIAIMLFVTGLVFLYLRSVLKNICAGRPRILLVLERLMVLIVFLIFGLIYVYFRASIDIDFYFERARVREAIKATQGVLTDPQKPERLILYRIQHPHHYGLWGGVVYCYAEIYRLSPRYQDFLKTTQVKRHVDIEFFFEKNVDFTNRENDVDYQWGSCWRDVHQIAQYKTWVAPWIYRFSVSPRSTDESDFENAVVDVGSYIVFGSLNPHDHQTAIRFQSPNSTAVQAYIVQLNDQEVLMLLDLEHHLIKFVHRA